MEVNGNGKHSSLLYYYINYARKKFYDTGGLFTAVYFLSNLLIGPISWSVCAWQAFTALCKEFYNTSGLLTALYFLSNLLIGPISWIVCAWQAFTA
jgi:hypothetical protein